MPRKFVSSKQRAAVMAKLRSSGLSFSQAKTMSYAQLRKRGVYLKPAKDTDKDGVVNSKDCKPFDPNKQGIIHDTIEKIEKFKDDYDAAKERKLQAKIDKEREKLEKQQKFARLALERDKLRVQAQNDLARERKELQDLKNEQKALKRQAFKSSVIGKTVSGAVAVGKSAGRAAWDIGKDVGGMIADKPAPRARSPAKRKSTSRRKSTKKSKKKSNDDWDLGMF